jgi:hypothetical protein
MGLDSCRQDGSNGNASDNSSRGDSLNLKLNIKPFENVQLNAEADSIARNWSMYNSLKNEVSRIEDYTLQDVISNVMSIERVVDSLQKTIPKKLDTLPVKSRINVLNSKAKFILLLSQKQQPKLRDIMILAEEYPLEFNALNIQLNEFFIKMPDFGE